MHSWTQTTLYSLLFYLHQYCYNLFSDVKFGDSFRTIDVHLALELSSEELITPRQLRRSCTPLNIPVMYPEHLPQSIRGASRSASRRPVLLQTSHSSANQRPQHTTGGRWWSWRKFYFFQTNYTMSTRPSQILEWAVALVLRSISKWEQSLKHLSKLKC